MFYLHNGIPNTWKDGIYIEPGPCLPAILKISSFNVTQYHIERSNNKDVRIILELEINIHNSLLQASYGCLLGMF